jgi:hypothetical protein
MVSIFRAKNGMKRQLLDKSTRLMLKYLQTSLKNKPV